MDPFVKIAVKNEFFLQLSLLQKISKFDLINTLQLKFDQEYSLSHNYFPIERIVDNILENQSEKFALEKKKFENGSEVLFITLQKFITVFVKNNVTNKSHSFFLHPSNKANFLVDLLKKFYQNDFHDISTFSGKSLIRYKNLSLSELGIVDGSELSLKNCILTRRNQ